MKAVSFILGALVAASAWASNETSGGFCPNGYALPAETPIYRPTNECSKLEKTTAFGFSITAKAYREIQCDGQIYLLLVFEREQYPFMALKSDLVPLCN